MAFELLGYHLTNNLMGYASLKRNAVYIDEVIPTWLSIGEKGNLIINHDKGEVERLARLLGREAITPLVQNQGLKSEVSNRLINDKKAANRAIQEMTAYLQKNRLKGLNLDLEGVDYNNKELFNQFCKKLAAVCHRQGYEISLSIPAKTENNKDQTWSGAYQYDFLGQLADRIILMAYDYHWPGGMPGPIAPLSWVKDVIDYAIIEIPIEKIYLGIGFYGYDWELNSEKKARGLVYPQLKRLQDKYKIEAEWDQEAQSPYLRYGLEGQQHEVWFENSQSILKKLELVKEFQLAGVAFWRLGQEDPEVWQMVKEIKRR